MRLRYGLAGIVVLGSATLLPLTTPASAVCNVFDRHPCMPTVCSVFRRRPCIPEIDYPIGQDLRLTIESAAAEEHPSKAGDAAPDRKLDTLRAMFDALRACWVPPDKDEARPGTQMSVRFAFKRSGEIIATPRVTYV